MTRVSSVGRINVFHLILLVRTFTMDTVELQMPPIRLIADMMFLYDVMCGGVGIGDL